MKVVARVDRITNLPSEPGDTIRSKKTKTDYIVQSVVPFAMGGASIYYLMRALDGKVEEYVANSLKDLDFTVVRKNVEKLTPEQVRSFRIETLKNSLKGNEELMRKIDTPEGSVFKDLLLVINDMEEEQIKDKFRKFGESLVTSTDRVYSSAEILEMITESLGDSASFYSPEALEELAEGLGAYASKRSGDIKNTQGITPKFNSISSVLGFQRQNGKQGLLDRAAQYAISDTKKGTLSSRTEFARGVRKTLLSPTSMTNMEINRVPELAKIFKNYTDPYSRVAELVSRSLGSPKTSSKTVQNITKRILDGDQTLIDALIDTDTDNVFSKLYRTTKYQSKSGLAAKTYARRASRSQTRSRPTKRVNLKKVFQGVENTGNTHKYIAMSKDFFINDYIGGRDVTITTSGNTPVKQFGNLRQDVIKQEIQGIDDVIFAPATTFRTNYESTDAIDLDNILFHNANTPVDIKRQLLGQMKGEGITSGFATKPPSHPEGTVFKVNDQEFSSLADAREALSLRQSVGDIKAFSSLGDQIPLYPSRIAVRPSEEQIQSTYEMARDEARLAYYTIKKSSGDSNTVLLGSAMNVPVDVQIERAIAAAKNKGQHSLSLDIENNPLTGEIEEIGISHLTSTGEANTIFNFTKGSSSEVTAIINAADKLEQAKFVGTMTAHDFDTLITRANRLAIEMSNPSMKSKLLNAASIFKQVEQKAGFDFSVGIAAAGEFNGESLMLGNINQQRLTKLLFGRDELHEAVQDSIDALHIQQKLNVADLSAAPSLEGTIFQVKSTRLNRDGAFGKLLGFERRGAGTAAVFEEMVFDNGAFQRAGGLFELKADGPSQMGASMKGMQAVGFEDKLAPGIDAESMLSFSQRRVEERAGRYLRGINPLNKTFVDSTTAFSNEPGNIFGLHELSVINKTRQLLNEPVAKEFINNVSSTPAQRQTEAESLAKMLAGSVQMGDDLSAPGYQSRLLESVTTALTDSQYRKAITKSELTNFLDSSAGSKLVEMTEKGINGSFYNQYAAPLLGLELMSMTAGGPNATHFVSESRLSLSAFNKSGPFQGVVSTVLGENTTEKELTNAVKSLIGQAMTATTTPKAADASAFVENAIGPEGLYEVQSRVNGIRSFKKIENNLGALEELSRTLHTDYKVKDLADQIDQSEHFRTMMQSQLMKRADLLTEHKDVLGVKDAEMVSSRFKNIVEEEFAKTSTASEGVASSIMRAHKELGEEAFKLTKDVTKNSLAFEDIKNLDPNIVQELVNSSLNRVKRFDEGEMGGTDILQHIFDKTRELRGHYFKMDVSPRDQAISLNAFIKEAEDRVAQTAGGNPIEEVHSTFLKFYQAAQAAKAAEPTMIEMQSKLVNKAVSIAGATVGEEGEKAAQHAFLLGKRIIDTGEFKKVAAPLLAVGGLLALIAASNNPKEEYSGGYASKRSPGIIPAMSEIPGTSHGFKTFVGQEAPFQINLNIEAYVNGEAEKNAIHQKLYDVVTGSTRVSRVNVRDRDFRENDHKRMAIDYIRERL